MARKKIVAGNWKMNMTPSQAVKLVEELKPLVVSDDVEVVYCVPAIDIVPVVEAVKGTNVAVVLRRKRCIYRGNLRRDVSRRRRKICCIRTL